MGQAGRLNEPTPCVHKAARRRPSEHECNDGDRMPEIRNSVASLRLARWTVFFLIAFSGLLVRLPQLNQRPMHTDEAVNAYIIGQILEGKPYTYDPRDRHGPTLALVAVSLAKMQGVSSFSDLTETELRLTSVFAGTITIVLFGAAVDMFGFLPCLIAALLFAFAPLPVYYDRYFIHESIFVCATFGLILAGLRAYETRKLAHATLAAACAALMLASKETAALHFVSLTGATLAVWPWNRRQTFRPDLSLFRTSVAAVGLFVLLSAVLFTWFGRNWNSLPALFQVLPNLLARAAADGHQKPLWYYLQLLVGGWSGGLIFSAACLGILQAIRKRDPSPYTFLAIYFLLLVIGYSAIPYKTPWLALNFWLPITILGGLGVQSLWDMQSKYPASRSFVRATCMLLGAIAAIAITHDTWERVFVHPADETNPYAYAHTSEDLLGLPAEIEKLARQGAIAAPRIAVVASDPWPLPWYLRHFAAVGFWQPGQQPGIADFYITSTEAADQYSELLKNFRPQFFGSRPGVLILLWSPVPR